MPWIRFFFFPSTEMYVLTPPMEARMYFVGSIYLLVLIKYFTMHEIKSHLFLSTVYHPNNFSPFPFLPLHQQFPVVKSSENDAKKPLFFCCYRNLKTFKCFLGAKNSNRNLGFFFPLVLNYEFFSSVQKD